jgi:hypothetical protein
MQREQNQEQSKGRGLRQKGRGKQSRLTNVERIVQYEKGTGKGNRSIRVRRTL